MTSNALATPWPSLKGTAARRLVHCILWSTSELPRRYTGNYGHVSLPRRERWIATPEAAARSPGRAGPHSSTGDR